jgi:hypothetical protein
MYKEGLRENRRLCQSRRSAPRRLRYRRVASRQLREIPFVVGGTVWRRSDTKNARGLYAPPFKSAVVDPVRFPMEPRVGKKVTVIPDNRVEPFDLSIVSTERHELPELR